MRKTLIIIGFALLAGGMLTACIDQENPVGESSTRVINMIPKAKPMNLTDEQKTFVQKNNDFSFYLFRTVNELDEKKHSNFLSPICVTYMLGMLNDGASGDTSKEILSMLGFGDSDTNTLNEFCLALIKGASEVDPSVSVDISSYIAANSHQDVKLKGQFQDDMEKYYKAEAEALDFTSPDALKTINGWCSEKTNGKIDKLIDKLDDDMLLVLLNAVNFKAAWCNEFKESATVEKTFTLEDGTTKELPMMQQTVRIGYGSSDTFSAIQIPYGGKEPRWYMYILLPKESKTIDDVLAGLNAKSWQAFLKGINGYQLDIKVPKFTVKSNNDLIPSITKLGAPSIFDPTKADFSKMSNYKNLYVGKLLQKATIDVNEKGTEAVAVTVAGMAYGASGEDPILEQGKFQCDRPFVYLIQEVSSGAIYFIGTYRGE